jgi:hypothetical protein
MAFINTTYISDITLDLTLSRLGRNYLFNNNANSLRFQYFSIGDDDIIYDFNLENSGVKEDFVPVMRGEYDRVDYSLVNSCVKSVSTNVDVKNKIKKLSTGNVFFDRFVNVEPFSLINVLGNDTKSINTDKYKFLLVDKNDNTKFNHLFRSFNLPYTIDEVNSFNLKYSFTALRDLSEDRILVLDINKTEFGEVIDGKTINFSFYTQNPTLRRDIASSFFYNSSIENISDYNNLISDNNDFSQEFGSTKTGFDTNNTNVAYLFCKQIKNNVTNSNAFWETNSNLGNGNSDRPIGVFKKDGDFTLACGDNLTPNIDLAVGIAFLDKGLLVITNQDLIDDFISFISSEASGTVNDLKDYTTFNTVNYNNNLSLSYKTYAYEYRQTGIIILTGEEFNFSVNPTFNKIGSNDVVKISNIAVYNLNNELICYGKFSRPLTKSKSSETNIRVVLSL